MPTPVIERITLNLVAALEAVTTANGYQHTILEVKRLQRGPFTPAALPAAALYLPHESAVVPDGRGNIGIEDLEADFVIEVWKQEDVPDQLDQELILLRADVYKAILADSTRGGNALQTLYQGHDLLLTDGSDSQGGLDMYFRVQYRHYVGDMTVGGA